MCLYLQKRIQKIFEFCKKAMASNLCSLCLTSRTDSNLSAMSPSPRIALQQLYNVLVDKEDMICTDCTEFLECVMDFKETVLKSLAKVRSLRKMTKVKEADVELNEVNAKVKKDDVVCVSDEDEINMKGTLKSHLTDDLKQKITDKEKFTVNLEGQSKKSYNRKRAVPTQQKFCQICYIKCGDKNEYFTHLKVVHEDLSKHELDLRGTSCEVCGKVFLTVTTAMRHKKSVHPELFPKKETEDQEAEFAPEHVKIGEKSGWHCCGLMYPSWTKLIHHQKHMHPSTIKTKVYSCKVCGQPCAGRPKLINHYQVEHKGVYVPTFMQNKEGKCDICGKKFSSLMNAMRHKRTAHAEPDSE